MNDETALDDTTRPGSQEPGASSFGEAPEPRVLSSGDEIGPCTIERVLGRGGMGVVYKARHRGLDVAVAVKVLPGELAEENPDLAARFLREARLAARLRHPNVVSVLDVGKDEERGLFYMVQDFVAGGSLRDRLRRGPLSEAEALNVASAIGRALAEAERAGIVHRDIKPDNILLTAEGRVQLADLGLAKQQDGGFDEELTAPKAVLGTPIYMSPEQIRETRSVDIRSDLYSLGATLYHLVTGEPPFRAARILGLVHKIVTDPAPDPRGLRPELSEPFAALLLRLLEKEPEARFASAAVFVETLDGLRRERGQPIGTPVELSSDRVLKLEAVEAPSTPILEKGGSQELVESSASQGEAPPPPRRLLPWLLLTLVALLLMPLGLMVLFRFADSRPGPLVRPPSEQRRTEVIDAIPAPMTPPPPAEEKPEPAKTGGELSAEQRSELAVLKSRYPELAGLAQGARVALSFDAGAAVIGGEDELVMARDQVSGAMLPLKGPWRVGEGAAGERSAWLSDDGCALDLPGLERERSVALWFRVPELSWPQVLYDSGPRPKSSSPHDGFAVGSGLMLGLCANPRQQPEKLPAAWRYGPNLTQPRLWVGLWARDFFTEPRAKLTEGWHHLALVLDADRLSLWLDGERVPLRELHHRSPDVASRRFGPPSDQVDVPWRSEGAVGARLGRVRDALEAYRDPKREGGLWDLVGFLDEVAVWDRPLSPAEIRAMVRFTQSRGLLEGSYCQAISLLRRADGG